MRKIVILSILIVFASCKNEKETIVQEPTPEQEAKYLALTEEAFNLYQAQEYLKSAQKYSEAFKEKGEKSNTTDRYNAACSWALAKEIDSSYTQLFHIAKRGDYSNYDHITSDPDLGSLFSDKKKWDKLLGVIRDNEERKEANFNKPLVATLDTIFNEDQGLRNQIQNIEAQYGRDSEEMEQHWQSIAEKDSINLIKVQKILDGHGWLGSDVIGRKGNTTLFLVIQHAPLEVQEKYLPMMREAVKKGNAQPSSLALLEDRVALRNGKRQIYGSQIGRDEETGEFYVSPIEDPENVDKRRAEVGLGPLADYISNWDIIWDVEKHKKKTAALEAKKE